MRQRRCWGLLLALLAAPIAAWGTETSSVTILPPHMKVRRVIPADQTTLDVKVRTVRSEKAMVTLSVSVNGREATYIDLGAPTSSHGRTNLYEAEVDLSGLKLAAGDVISLTATVSDGKKSKSDTVSVRVRAVHRGAVIIVPTPAPVLAGA